MSTQGVWLTKCFGASGYKFWNTKEFSIKKTKLQETIQYCVPEMLQVTKRVRT